MFLSSYKTLEYRGQKIICFFRSSVALAILPLPPTL